MSKIIMDALKKENVAVGKRQRIINQIINSIKWCE